MPRFTPRKDRGISAFGLSRSFKLAPSPKVGAIAPDALLELAWDGHRVLVCRVKDDVRLFSADYREWTQTFAPLCSALRRVRADDFVLDGFVCALGDGSKPSFDLLREHVATKGSARLVLVVWDALRLGGEDLRTKPLEERRARIAPALAGVHESLAFSEPLAGDADAVESSVRKLGMRGIVGRPRTGAYGLEWIANTTLAWERSLSAPPVVTNKDKILFPRDGIKKQTMVEYYADIAPILLRYTKDRPIVCQRWPDGIDDFTWYQHRVPPRAPDYLKAVFIEGNRRIVIENESALLWMANQAAITFHGFASRVSSLEQPDWVVLDLDPGEKTTWETTIKVALAVRQLLELLELPSIVKTSGQKGMHVLIPIAPGHTVQQAHELGRRAAIMIARLFPNDVALDPTTEKREGRLYLDHLQSYVGKSLVLPYSLRAADGAPVSAPIGWDEVSPRLNPRDFNFRTMRARLDAKGDLAEGLVDGSVQLAPVLVKMRS